MITEDYVSFETAKLLKEKGFDENTNCQYPVGGIYIGEVGEYNITDRSRNPENYIPAPTLQMALKWLREVHKLYVVVRHYVTQDGFFSLFDVKLVKEKGIVINLITKTGFTTYEEACEAGIKYCLEILI